MREPGPKTQRKGLSLGRMLPLLVLFSGLILFFALGLNRYLTFSALSEHRDWLIGRVEDWGALAPLAYIAVYAAVIALSVPGGAVLTIAGGFLFGTLAATAYVVVGATLGAVAVFLAARTALADFLHARAGPAMRRMERGFQENAFNYLLFLRLIPIFPFWLVNLVPAFLNVRLRTFAVGTFIGIIPGSFVYASVGNGLGALLETGAAPDLAVIFEPQILLPIIGLAVLAVLPVVYRKLKARNRSSAPGG